MYQVKFYLMQSFYFNDFFDNSLIKWTQCNAVFNFLSLFDIDETKMSK